MFFSYFGPNFFLEDLISVNTSTVLSVAQASFLGILIDPSSLDPTGTSCECNEFLRPLSSKSIVYFLLGEKRVVSISDLRLAPTCWTLSVEDCGRAPQEEGTSLPGTRLFLSLSWGWGIQWLSVIATYPEHTVP